MEEPKIHKEAVKELSELSDITPAIEGVSTGTRLDELFFKVEKGKKKSLGGVPKGGVLNIVGVPESGKSVLVEQVAIHQASLGSKILFITTESPAAFLYTALKGKAEAMGIDFSKIEGKMVVVDASMEERLREDLPSLLATLKYAIKSRKTTICIVDSITGLYEHREIMARSIVRRIYNLLKREMQTALLVSQKRSSQAMETPEAAGGLAVAHIVDGTIVLEKRIITTKFEENLYGMSVGEILRTLRIDGCRLCGHDPRPWVVRITDEGLIEIIEPLVDFIKRERKRGEK
ncbi:KaiC domain-containing protein [Methanosarcinales archaeon]|nr:MAG: KaiC domain-containing protein [Methanosarcinales archaeon]